MIDDLHIYILQATMKALPLAFGTILLVVIRQIV